MRPKLAQRVIFIEKIYYTQNISQEWLIQHSVSSFNIPFSCKYLGNTGILQFHGSGGCTHAAFFAPTNPLLSQCRRAERESNTRRNTVVRRASVPEHLFFRARRLCPEMKTSSTFGTLPQPITAGRYIFLHP